MEAYWVAEDKEKSVPFHIVSEFIQVAHTIDMNALPSGPSIDMNALPSGESIDMNSLPSGQSNEMGSSSSMPENLEQSD